jgi:cation:H+ antiporter
MAVPIFIFIVSCILLFWSGNFLVNALMRMARFLGWREFVVAFFAMAFAGAIPNLFVGINSALYKIPQLSFGDIVGGNLIDFTLAVALVVLITKGLPAETKMVQKSSIFTIAIAILPLLLILDGTLGRGDGILLISIFFFYIFWLFSKKERFKKVYENNGEETVKEFSVFIKDLGRIILSLILLLAASAGIVTSASSLALALNLSLPLIGILIVALGNSLPEIYFAVASARKGHLRMILGNLMGSIIVPSTLVLGIVALICPIEITNFSPFAIGRAFLIISALFFLIFLRSDRKITRKEAMFLLGIYLVFVACEILMR